MEELCGIDVSFIFLDLVREVEWNIRDQRWQSALALALTLPDICGSIAYPEIVKKYRDGRIVLNRQNHPTRDVGNQYIRWFDSYAAPFFKVYQNDEEPYICGERCWQLRCEYLHQNKGFFNEEKSRNVRFHLGVNCGTSVCRLDTAGRTNGSMDIRIDIEQFCLRMCQAAKAYYEKTHREKSFDLYNTPVLDFIERSAPATDDGKTVALMCSDPAYSLALQKALQNITSIVHVFATSDMARKALGRKKPDLWIVTDALAAQTDQPWRADKTTPVLLLTRFPEMETPIQKVPGRMLVLGMPILPKNLRNAATQLLENGETGR